MKCRIYAECDYVLCYITIIKLLFSKLNADTAMLLLYADENIKLATGNMVSVDTIISQ